MWCYCRFCYARGRCRVLGDDLFGDPEAEAGAANDFNAIDVFEHHVVNGPEDASKPGRVHVAAVNENEHAFGELIAETADADEFMRQAPDMRGFRGSSVRA